jgi:hypothetical protein
MDRLKLSAVQQKRYLELMNRVGNLQLLITQENLEKSNQEFEDWLASRDHSVRRWHLIPDDNHHLSFDHFDEFINAREELIRKH